MILLSVTQIFPQNWERKRHKHFALALSDSTFLIREGGTKAQILVQRVGTLDRTS